MTNRLQIVADPQATDERLAAELATLYEMPLPSECVAGVAANLRLLQRHLDILRKEAV